MNTDLLSQLNTLIAEAEQKSADAELWRETRRLMAEAGYGPRITPAQIVALVPNVHGINEILAATQEVGPASAGPQMPRRKLTADDELEITNRNAAGQSPQEIADAIGVTRKVVVAWLDAN
jgi:hypothetical protein